MTDTTVSRVADARPTADDIREALRLLNREYRNFGGILKCRPIGSSQEYRMVPDLTSADDACRFLPDRFVMGRNADGGWTVRHAGGESVDSRFLGCAMWAAWFATRSM